MSKRSVGKIACGAVIQIVGWAILLLLLEVLGIDNLYFVFAPFVIFIGIGIALSVGW